MKVYRGGGLHGGWLWEIDGSCIATVGLSSPREAKRAAEKVAKAVLL